MLVDGSLFLSFSRALSLSPPHTHPPHPTPTPTPNTHIHIHLHIFLLSLTGCVSVFRMSACVESQSKRLLLTGVEYARGHTPHPHRTLAAQCL